MTNEREKMSEGEQSEPERSEANQSVEQAAQEWVRYNCSFSDEAEAAEPAFLAGAEWEAKRILEVLKEIEATDKPFTTAGMIERASIIDALRRRLDPTYAKSPPAPEGENE